MKLIKLTFGKSTIIDDADFELLSKCAWHLKRDKNKYYARGKYKGKNVLLHKLLIYVPDGFVIDHINGNGLDNRRSNLRVITQRENVLFGIIFKDKKYRGCRKTKYNKWEARIRIGDKRIYLGSFNTPNEASIAYENKLMEIIT